jgi:TolA-binding protein
LVELFISRVVKNQQQQQLDLADRIAQVQGLIDEINREIENIQANLKVAFPTSSIVRFRAKGKGGAYWYYKWQSPQPIFVTKSGNPSRYQYIGKAGSLAFLEAVEMLRNRTSISALEQVLRTLELARLDLVEESTRINEQQ